MEIENLPQKKSLRTGHTYVQWILAILVNITSLNYGLETGWISPVTSFLQSEESPTGPLTDTQLSWVASTLSLCAAIGVSMYAAFADRFGRKLGVMAVILPQFISWVLKLVATNLWVLILSRVLSGLATGGCFQIVPIYVKEISQDNNRGLLGSILIMAQNIGILIIYAIGAYLDYYVVLWISGVIPLIGFLMMFKAPETPAYLIKIGKYDRAVKTIAFLRGLDIDDKKVTAEIEYLKNEDEYYKTIPDVTYRTIFANKSWRKAFFLMMAILTMTTFNGCFAIITYASSIMESSGVTWRPELQTLSFPLVMIGAAFVSMACVERFGRKILESVTAGLIGICLICLAVIINLQVQGTYPPSWMTVVCMVVALFSYAAGVQPIPYIMMAEIFNFQIRCKLIGILVTYAWTVAFVQLIVFGPISNAVGIHNTFYFFGAFNFLGMVFVLLCLPETKGKTTEEIEKELR